MVQLKKPTTLKVDFTALSLLSQDLLALERHYHKYYYREYTQKVENLSTPSGTNLYKDVELEKLFQTNSEFFQK